MATKVTPSIFRPNNSYRGYFLKELQVDLTEGDYILEQVPIETKDIQVWIEPSAGGATLLSQSTDQFDVAEGDLHLIPWEFGNIALPCVCTLMPGKWLKVSAVVGTAHVVLQLRG